jgi:chromosome segregation ATPase
VDSREVDAHTSAIPEVAPGPSEAAPPQNSETELEQARAEIARQHALFKKALDECERVKANVTHVQAELKSFQADRQQLKADAAQARLAIQAAEAHASELAVAVAAAQQEAAGLREQMETETAAWQERLAAQEQVVHDRDAQLGQALRNLAKYKSDLSASVVEAAGLRSELQAHQQGLQATGQQLREAKSELQETKSLLEAVTEEHRATTQDRDRWRERADGFEQDLRKLDTGRDLLELREKHQQLQAEYEALDTKFGEYREETEKNMAALKGIVSRQNATLAGYHGELRTLRRGRFAVRFVYGLFFLALVGLGYFACTVFKPSQFTELIQAIKNFKIGGF